MAQPLQVPAPASPNPRTKRRWTWVIVLVVIAIGIVLAGTYLAWYVGESQLVEVHYAEGCQVGYWYPNVTYAGNSTGYLIPLRGPPGECSETSVLLKLTVGEHFTGVDHFINTDPTFAHIISAASVSFPFGLVSTSPTLPSNVGPNSTLVLTITFSAPESPGTYDYPSGTVTTV